MGYEESTRSRVARAVREVSARIDPSEEIRFAPGPAGLVKRRSMVKQIGLAAKQYDLREEIEAFVVSAGCASVAGLDDQRLVALSSWLGDVMQRYYVAADSPDAPPAR